MKELTRLILEDMRPALGVTETAAIAFAAAAAKEHISGELQLIRVVLNSGMYKNAFTCGIPNSREQGNQYAAALGYVAAKADRALECLDGVRPSDNLKAKALVRGALVEVRMGDISSRIFIQAEIVTSEGQASVTIQDAHTNITQITENGKVVFNHHTQHHGAEEKQQPLIHRYTLRRLLHYSETVPLQEISFIQPAYEMNLALFRQTLQSKRTPFTQYLLQRNHGRMISDDEQLTASLLCNAAIEARVLGLSPRKEYYRQWCSRHHSHLASLWCSESQRLY